jgi:hypothetical protein
LQAANAIEVLTNFARHGATQKIVSGAVGPQLSLDSYVRHAENLSVILLRLRADSGELRWRYMGRGFGVERLDELMVLAAALDRHDVGVPLDVSDLAPEQVIDALIDLIGARGRRTAADPEPASLARPLRTAERIRSLASLGRRSRKLDGWLGHVRHRHDVRTHLERRP